MLIMVGIAGGAEIGQQLDHLILSDSGKANGSPDAEPFAEALNTLRTQVVSRRR